MSHAILSPSGSSRWLACTPSARLEQQFPDKAGPAAAEGTLAHSLGELIIRYRTGLISKKVYLSDLAKIEADKQYETAMYEYMDQYAVYVLEQFAEAQKHTKDALLFLEVKLNLTDYVPEGFGTGDVVIIANKILDLIDLKYGKGVPVSADNNRQMMLYALGALREYDYLYDIETVRMTIYQPRLDSISVFEMPVVELRLWAEKELRPRAALAFDGKGEFAPGDHCRFCKAKAVCKANADFNLELAKYDFQENVLLEPHEISDIMNRADRFIKWINAVEEHALFEAVNNGAKWPGYKVVEGRSNRVYTNKEKVLNDLIEHGCYKQEEVTEPATLLGITKLEKAIGKEQFATWVNEYITKPPGKPTLVVESDKRPEYNSVESAQLDFADCIDN